MSDTDYNTIISNKNILVSTNESSLGSPLKVELNNDNIVFIYLTLGNETINFLDKIKQNAKFLRPKHRDNIILFDKLYKFYLLSDSRSSYVLAVKWLDEFNIDKIRYSLNGVVMNHVTNTLLDNGIVSRKSGNLEIFIKNNNVINSKQNMKLIPIDKPSIKYSIISNPNIGVIDCEMYDANDNIKKVYALGFKTNLDKNPVTYYIDNSINPHELVLKLINELLRPKDNDVKFYCHNFGNYDAIFILKVLSDYNDNNDKDKYELSCRNRDKDILSLRIIKTINNNKRSLTIYDSLCMLNNSLSALAINFEVNTLKGIFPHKFAKENNLFYLGNTPDISYYKDIKYEVYKSIFSSQWSFKEESLKYLNDDLNSLYEVVVKANKQVFLDYGVNMTDNLTISGLAVKIFLRNFYDNKIPLVNKTSMYREIKDGYYGAITEVYKPYGEDLYYYDVNSLYPYVAGITRSTRYSLL